MEEELDPRRNTNLCQGLEMSDQCAFGNRQAQSERRGVSEEEVRSCHVCGLMLTRKSV